LKTAVSGNPKFFLGTDSAPHPAISKRGDKVAAGVFTQPHAVGFVVDALQIGVEKEVLTEEEVTQEKLKNFLSDFGRAFYQLPDGSNKETIVLRKPTESVQDILRNSDSSIEVVPFRRGKLTWGVEWK
jgi:dihydroorotase